MSLRHSAPTWNAAAEPGGDSRDERMGSPLATQGVSQDHRKLLLLVEDNGADVFLVEQAVEFFQVPVRIAVAEDGEAATLFFERADADPEAPCPAILLLDLNLPKRSGAEVLERVRSSKRCRNIPVIVLTSSDSPDDRQRAAQLGADRYFRKPTSYREFLQIGAVLNEVLGQTAH